MGPSCRKEDRRFLGLLLAVSVSALGCGAPYLTFVDEAPNVDGDAQVLADARAESAPTDASKGESDRADEAPDRDSRTTEVGRDGQNPVVGAPADAADSGDEFEGSIGDASPDVLGGGGDSAADAGSADVVPGAADAAAESDVVEAAPGDAKSDVASDVATTGCPNVVPPGATTCVGSVACVAPRIALCRNSNCDQMCSPSQVCCVQQGGNETCAPSVGACP